MVAVFLAYQAGTFDNDPRAPEKGMDKEAFARWALASMGLWDDAIILEVRKPVALIGVQALGPHFLITPFWFPWATLRNKIEASLKFVLDYKNQYHLLLATDEREFMTHLFRYGVVRAIGNSHGFRATLYESVGA